MWHLAINNLYITLSIYSETPSRCYNIIQNNVYIWHEIIDMYSGRSGALTCMCHCDCVQLDKGFPKTFSEVGVFPEAPRPLNP